MTIKYVNCENEEIALDGSNGIWCNISGLQSYEWTVTERNNRVSKLSRKTTKKDVGCVIYTNGYDKNIALRNQLFSVVEKDVINETKGRLYVGDYYMYCYIYATEYNVLFASDFAGTLTLKIVTDKPYWIKETSYSFSVNDETQDEYLDYPIGYEYDYKSSGNVNYLVNSYFASCDFRMIIYGEAINPTLRIGGHEYKVNVELYANEYLMIDTQNKTIVKVDSKGKETNAFPLRSLDSYVFEKIASGTNRVSYEKDFSFDVVLIENRSEPPWI